MDVLAILNQRLNSCSLRSHYKQDFLAKYHLDMSFAHMVATPLGVNSGFFK